MRRWLGVLLGIGTVTVALAACGGGDPVASTPQASGSASAPAPTVTTVAPASQSASAAAETTTTTAPTTTTESTTTTTTSTTTTTTAPTTTTTAPTTTTTAPAVTPPPSPLVDSTPAPSSPSGTEWTVAPGESFWSIAADLASTRLGHAASVQEIDPIWRALIDANRDLLPQPGNPSLLYIGTVLTVPP